MRSPAGIRGQRPGMCFDAGQIARAATLGTDDPHFSACLDCRRRLGADRAMRDRLRALPVPALTAVHRRALAAEIIAVAEMRPLRTRPVAAFAAMVAAAAAVVALAAWPRELAGPSAPAAPGTDPESIAIATTTVARDDSPPALAAPALGASRGTTFKQSTGDRRDIIMLAEGKLTLDTRAARNVDVHVGDAVVRVDDAAVEIQAHDHALVSVRVEIGAARIDTTQQHVTVERDTVWGPGPSAKTQALAAFRAAWVALRAGRNHEAMELFDRAVDPIVAEEASYWAAIAARRAGDPSADQRIARFLSAFPQSAYADDIRDPHR